MIDDTIVTRSLLFASRLYFLVTMMTHINTTRQHDRKSTHTHTTQTLFSLSHFATPTLRYNVYRNIYEAQTERNLYLHLTTLTTRQYLGPGRKDKHCKHVRYIYPMAPMSLNIQRIV